MRELLQTALVSLAVMTQGEAPAVQKEPWEPTVAQASTEGEAAIAAMEYPSGFRVELFASEPMVANPVCMYVDNRGVCWVAETFRHGEGVTDIRDHMAWKVDDLASRTVDDRLALLNKWEGAGVAQYEQAEERIRRIVDRDADGVADEAGVFAGGFDNALDGIAAGLLVSGDSVYYTCIPNLWRLVDTDSDGVVDQRQSLSSGYGVNIALLGHDLHGLRIGPDGRLYFSSGDRGFHVETPEGVIAHAHTGAILRCELDGSKLEVFHSGLRNPQELVFDAFGNLFTGDNNSDGGDKARFVQAIEGADSGWRYSYQWIGSPVSRGPWNEEKLWYPHFEGQAAYILPPIDNLASGPAGLTIAPGSGLPSEYQNHFFLCDFRGARSYSGIHSFDLNPRGAGFELGDVEPFIWNVLATDCDFGPDGALWFCDWVEGWSKPGKGRVYRIVSEASETELALQVQSLLGGGIAAALTVELGNLLGHPDQRVRQEAQFELVRRGPAGDDILCGRALEGPELLVRLHGIWGLGQAVRAGRVDAHSLLLLLADDESEVRAQVAILMGEQRVELAVPALIAMLGEDDLPRMQMFAALALWKLGDESAVPELLNLLRRTEESDPPLRHAVLKGLEGCASTERIVALQADPSPFVRIGAVVVLRSLRAVECGDFLADSDSRVVEEAARAIHDASIASAFPALAALLPSPDMADGAQAAAESNAHSDAEPTSVAWVAGATSHLFLRRVMNANYRNGDEAGAWRLAQLSADHAAPADARSEALRMLREWKSPAQVDRVTGEFVELGTRSMEYLPRLTEWLEQRREAMPAAVEVELIKLIVTANRFEALGWLAERVAQERLDVNVRRAALNAVAELDPVLSLELIRVAFTSAEGGLRSLALELLEQVGASDALPLIPDVLDGGELAERRSAYAILGRAAEAANEQAEALLLHELGQLENGLVPAELVLDLVQAAEKSALIEIAESLERHRAKQSPSAALAEWLDCLFGGNELRGSEVYGRADLSCVRCHGVGAEAAGDSPTALVGPALAGVGTRRSRMELLESIVEPNRRILAGFEGTVLFHVSGKISAGRIVGEDDSFVTILNSDGELEKVAVDLITERRDDLSAMPEGLHKTITRTEMRDLLHYLSVLE